MKRLFTLFIIFTNLTVFSWATDNPLQDLTPEQFREKQKEFITEKAELTASEAAKFFPVYFELQDKKKELNDKAWKLLAQGKDNNLSEAEYEKMLLEVYDIRIQSDQLEKDYYLKFKKIISSKKIYMVQRAEMRFHRELVRNATRKEPPGQGPGPQRGRK